MDLEHLYPLITEAIRRAEALEDMGAPGVRPAYLEVSRLEERVTDILPASNPEGAVARRGAIRAALSAGEPALAQQLAKRFLAENDAEDELRADLRRLSEKAELSLADRILAGRLLAELEREQTIAPKADETVRTSRSLPKRKVRRT